ncbi:MAG: hypothetical protein CSA60_04355 [Neptuniibacter caesariensis]|uniref:Cds6 C-terminal domain-containing protein n=1 Tax=Neptuniibacter caesariensis TaxID=207954 RepID=A0A2G6JJR2_NEPCE|nr:MAG: hypothetical protein CSA60_04355 [Neptuniibacter caesariensis]
MADNGISSSELLLNNLHDHQVVRLEGSQNWLEDTVNQVKDFHPDWHEITGDLTLDRVQGQLGALLGVGADGAAIQKVLKQRLENEQKLLLIVNADRVDESALTYVLGLPSICNETGSSVTVLLLTTPALLSALKSSAVLAGKLDGYYQEEAAAPSGIKAFGLLSIVAGVCVLAASGWYVMQNNGATAPVVEQPVSSIRDSEGSRETKASVASATAKSVVSKPGATIPEMTITSDTKENAEKASGAELSSDRQLLAELSATVEQAENRNSPSVSNTLEEPRTVPDKQDSASAEISRSEMPRSEMSRSKKVPVFSVVSAKAGDSTAQVVAEVTAKQAYPSAARLNNEAEVQKVFRVWSKAWAEQDWENYIGSYLQNTTLYGVKMSVNEWRAFRKDRLLSPAWIKLQFGEPKYTRLNSHWYRVEFYQRFEKPGYADETTKRLELTLTRGGWKIASEAAQGTVVLKRGQ